MINKIIAYLESERKMYAKKARETFNIYRECKKAEIYVQADSYQTKKKELRSYIDYLKELKEGK